MKKLLFSAIALVAFSSVSMGNTVDIKFENLLELAPTCKSQALMDTQNYEQANGCLSETQWQFIYNAYLQNCKSLTKTIRLIED